MLKNKGYVMCIIHAPINRKTINVSNRDRTKKVVKPFNKELLKPDPNFVDERKSTYKEPERKKDFLLNCYNKV